MKLFAAFTALLLSNIAASAAILIFDGPAPLKTYGAEPNERKNRAMLVYDTTGGQVGILNYFGKPGRGKNVYLGTLPVEGGTISLKKGSITVLTGASRVSAQTGDFDSQFVSFRGRNSLLNRSTALTGPRVLNGISRFTIRTGPTLMHSEQSFSLVYQEKISNAANIAGDTFDAAISRAVTVLQNRGYSTAR